MRKRITCRFANAFLVYVYFLMCVYSERCLARLECVGLCHSRVCLARLECREVFYTSRVRRAVSLMSRDDVAMISRLLKNISLFCRM